MNVPRRLRPLAVALYAAFVGLLLASYVSPLHDIVAARDQVSTLEQDLHDARSHNTTQERLVSDLNTPEGVERAARERYGMIRPGERVYIVTED